MSKAKDPRELEEKAKAGSSIQTSQVRSIRIIPSAIHAIRKAAAEANRL